MSAEGRPVHGGAHTAGAEYEPDALRGRPHSASALSSGSAVGPAVSLRAGAYSVVSTPAKPHDEALASLYTGGGGGCADRSQPEVQQQEVRWGDGRTPALQLQSEAVRVHSVGVADQPPPDQLAAGGQGEGNCDEAGNGLSPSQLADTVRLAAETDQRVADGHPAAGEPSQRLVGRCGPRRAEYRPTVRRSLVFPAMIGAVPARALLDSGAEALFVSQAFVKLHGLATRPARQPLSVVMADGST